MWWAVAALAALAAISVRAKALDIPGAAGGFLLGTFVVLAGGAHWVALMVAFTGLGFLATFIGRTEKKARRVMEDRDGQRGLRNVLANGLAPALAALAALFLPGSAAALAFATAVAAVTADTLASEIGCLAKRVRRILPPFDEGTAGANGFVSRQGQIAAFVGSATIAALAGALGVISWTTVWVPAIGGWLGCQLDSVLGASLETDDLESRPLSKEDVNFIASVTPAFLVFVLVAVF